MRAKLAKQRDKRNLIYVISSDRRYLDEDLSDLESELQTLLPSRKKWKKLRKASRYKKGQLLNSIDKNIRTILYTIDAFKKENASEPFLIKLDEFITSIEDAIKDEDYEIQLPEIIPKKKDGNNESYECRPISMYRLKDRIIIGLANKYLSMLFDKYFYDDSFAFRTKQQNSKPPTHHDAIKRIKAYLKQQGRNKLWVAECDMKKFYDTVNHSIVKNCFKRLLQKTKTDNPTLQTKSIKRIFYSYLDSYAFNKDVLPLNDDLEYFKKYKIAKGQFGWVKEELIKNEYYKSINKSRIGVPQGGALSGLIANIVLDRVDKKFEKMRDCNLLYIRYCDDMLIIHPSKKQCKKAVNIYKKELESLKLIPHEFKVCGNRKEFWSQKSKSPYKWSNEKSDCKRWIGFVGYEINYVGDVRVRKKSLEREMKKQYIVVNDINKALEYGKQRAKNKKIEESVINRLIGMSVGRVKLWNKDSINNEMCWLHGFSEITDNKDSRTQLKRLDACRNKLFRKFTKKLKRGGDIDVSETKKPKKNKLPRFYGKPFSYYYQGIERKKQEA